MLLTVAHPPVALGAVCSDLGLSAVDEEFGSGDRICVLEPAPRAARRGIGGFQRT